MSYRPHKLLSISIYWSETYSIRELIIKWLIVTSLVNKALIFLWLDDASPLISNIRTRRSGQMQCLRLNLSSVNTAIITWWDFPVRVSPIYIRYRVNISNNIYHVIMIVYSEAFPQISEHNRAVFFELEVTWHCFSTKWSIKYNK